MFNISQIEYENHPSIDNEAIFEGLRAERDEWRERAMQAEQQAVDAAERAYRSELRYHDLLAKTKQQHLWEQQLWRNKSIPTSTKPILATIRRTIEETHPSGFEEEAHINYTRLADQVGMSPGTISKRLHEAEAKNLMHIRQGETITLPSGEKYQENFITLLPIMEKPAKIELSKNAGGDHMHLCRKGLHPVDSYKVNYCPVCDESEWYGLPGLRADADVTKAQRAKPAKGVKLRFTAKKQLAFGEKPPDEEMFCWNEEADSLADDDDAMQVAGPSNTSTSSPATCIVEEQLPITPPISEIISDTGMIEHENSQKQVAFTSPTLFAREDTRVGVVVSEPVEPPESMRRRKQWAVWRYEYNIVLKGKKDTAPWHRLSQEEQQASLAAHEKPKKIPYQARASRDAQRAKCNEPRTWSTYEEAKKKYEEAITWNMKECWNGLMYALAGDETGVDFDHCIVDGRIEPAVLERIQQLATYSELSPSGTGVHCLAKGTIPAARKTKEIEMYDHSRFFTFTGAHLVSSPLVIEARQEQLTALYESIAPNGQVVTSEQMQSCVYEEKHEEQRSEAILDEVSARVLAKARSAANSAKFCRLYDAGDWSAGYDSQSEADFALCSLLAYYSDNDAVVMDKLFRASALYRGEKWDRSVGRGDSYGERSIKNAILSRMRKDGAA